MQSSLRTEISKLRKDQRNTAIPILCVVYVLLAVIFISASMLSAFHWFWIVPAMGIVQYYVVISGHEAVHETL